jgi:diguanylate cyclase (GGDEF)-like protein
MPIEIVTHTDALRHTAKRVAIAVGATVVLTVALLAFAFGVNPDTNVRLGLVATFGVTIGAVIAAILTGVLTYRSSLAMQELNLAKKELLLISRTDQLTGLLNRRGYDEAAMRALEKARETNSMAVALMCDIDRFKAINDQFGHEFGDEVLVEIGNAIRSFGKVNGMVVARHGGEEFAAFMIGVTAEQATQRANRLREICAGTRISSSDGTSASVTISIGLAISTNRTSLPTIMRAADQALYLAKRRGRDRVVPAHVEADAIAA